MMTNALSNIKKMILFHDSYFIRFIVVTGMMLYIIISILLVFNNPFSSYSGSDEIIFNTPVKINDIIMQEKLDFKTQEYENVSKKKYTNTLIDEGVRIVGNIDALDGTLRVRSLKNNSEYNLDISSLEDRNIKSYPPFTFKEDNFFILGINNDGNDLLSSLLDGIKITLFYCMFSLISFLMFGVFLGILIGFYRGHFPELSSSINAVLKSLESIPILFSVLITFVTADMLLPTEVDYLKLPITYFFFGVFASPTLAKLVINKFNYLQDSDFIVALKLLGVSDRQIIFRHIIKYYCSSIIIFQAIYIFAHALYLDITLTFVRIFPKAHTLGALYYDTYKTSSTDYTDFIIFSIVVFSLLSTLFYLTRYLKFIAETNE